MKLSCSDPTKTLMHHISPLKSSCTSVLFDFDENACVIESMREESGVHSTAHPLRSSIG